MTRLSTRLFAILLGAAALVSACGGSGGGGDDGVAGVGTGGSGYAVGTVTGFGSVIVDGMVWRDDNARVQVEISPAAGTVTTTVRLGQRVQIEYDTEPNAKVIEVGAAVIGAVQSVDATATPMVLRVLRQTVRVNLDANAGPVTLFEGYGSAAAIAPGDLVEIHATPLLVAGTYMLQASRIEKLGALPGGVVRVQNVVQQASANGRNFRLGDLAVNATNATVLPTGTAIANGKTVTVWGPPPGGAQTSLNADYVRVRDLSINTKPSEMSGTVANLDSAARTFDLAGTRVDAAGANVVPGNMTLANGNFVIVRGSFRGDGSFVATQVRIRKKGTGGFDHEVSLTGPITDFTSLADFRVRGVRVDASSATLRSCNNVRIGNGIEVEIGGAIAGDHVQAELMVCR